MQTTLQNEAFQAAMNRLNERQRQAVEQIEGPVMVIAGPGTGKTQILAARIGYILEQTDSQPSNVLCLTYTDAGTIAMRKRLQQFIGSAAYQVAIHTFHSFANRVITENPEYFGDREMEVIGDLEQYEVLQQIIDEMDPEDPLRSLRDESYHMIPRLRDFIQDLKKEDWTSEFVNQCIDEHLEHERESDFYIYKRATKTAKKGDFKQAEWDKEVLKMEKCRSAARCFDRYREVLAARNRYDYADMILWVQEAFRKEEYLLRRYQEQFHYFLVDEYQDTNGSQNHLLFMLTDFFENPNVFAVGDDDQSIYRFQGANVENIHAFDQRFSPHVKQVVLTDNYRSTQALLDAAAALIDRNDSRLVRGAEKQLKSSNAELAGLEKPPVLMECDNLLGELAWVGNRIAEIRKQDGPECEIAVLYPKHDIAEDLASFLQFREIPIRMQRQLNVLDAPLVDQLLNLLTYLSGEAARPGSREDLLFGILHMDSLGVPLDQINALAARYRQDRLGGKRYSWREAMDLYMGKGETDLFNPDGFRMGEALKAAHLLLEALIRSVHNTPLQSLVEQLMHKTGIVASVLRSQDCIERMQELHSFFSFLKAENQRRPRLGLADFLETIELMRIRKLRVGLQRVIEQPGGVHFSTLHSSKGLEYDHVFIIGMLSKNWEKKRAKTSIQLPSGMLGSEDEESRKASELEEMRRLLYVGMTRARKSLHLSWAARDMNGKEVEKSAFIAQLEEDGQSAVSSCTATESDKLQLMQAGLLSPVVPDPLLAERALLDRFLEDYSLSFTHLDLYLRCPLSFYYEKILRIPEAKNPAMAYGSAYHKALERFVLQTVDPEAENPGFDEAFQWFARSMERNRDAFTDRSFETRLERGRQSLQAYLQHRKGSWSNDSLVEQDFRDIPLGTAVLNGKIDRIDLNGDSAVMIDYKTGSGSNKSKHLKPPEEDPAKRKEDDYESVHGGKYWRQAVFYKLLTDRAEGNKWSADKVSFEFVEPDDKGSFSIRHVVVRPEDQQMVTGQIQDAWRGIKAHEFRKGCGQKDCRWCNFQQSHYAQLPEMAESDYD